jgi:hypothetical protein
MIDLANVLWHNARNYQFTPGIYCSWGSICWKVLTLWVCFSNCVVINRNTQWQKFKVWYKVISGIIWYRNCCLPCILTFWNSKNMGCTLDLLLVQMFTDLSFTKCSTERYDCKSFRLLMLNWPITVLALNSPQDWFFSWFFKEKFRKWIFPENG